ncbi:substrate-binding and VWA domain-containing protein [Mumia sp. zg.B53]|uniref:substrate-binding and VWA domain-containing protein n=1 Tax=unclassified Mumia TaxID=2621872 RepID=UPI001C6E4CF2|nr:MULTISPECIES: substrate-binding and VWA domain-containing protein [unclassified Mumia]MBW9209180.1 substrate-binding and VWA domain-containing protein [Mumia sp. zg.B21]MBW9213790.1 substrate-binding and VWA domain-containing protein [Mumia sp. zg.B53]
MGGRHAVAKESDSGHKWQYGIGLVVIATILTGVFVLQEDDNPAAASCSTTRDVTVAAAPEIAPVVEAATKRVSGDACAKFTVEPQAPALVAQTLAIGEGAPDLWIPDSSLWLARVSAQLVEGAQGPQEIAKSVALSPIVLALPKDGPGRPETWLQAMSDPKFTTGDALATTSAAVPLLAAQAEAAKGLTSADQVSATMVTIAQRQSVTTPKTNPSELLAEVAKAGGSTVVSEQAFAAQEASPFVAVVPQTGSLLLDYPMAATSDNPGNKEVGKALASALGSADGVKDLTAAGFRTPKGEPLPEGVGVGKFAPITIDNPQLVAQTLRKWSVIALPAQMLSVVDVSGSMEAQAGDSSRMALTVEAALTGLSLMPDSWSVGSWAFSHRIDGTQDWKKLAAIRKLGTVTNGVKHRDLVVDATRSMPSLVGGGTGLYDTTLAAWRTVQAQYDPKSINSVVILTDGKNEDANSLSLSELLATLQRERDPARPVIVITIGITKDADASALEKIAKATGGQSYIAREPDEIANVFVKALEARG